jgi:dihydroorotase-like cyclic amidohydrolase
MPALLIKNGRVIDPNSNHDGVADVLINDGLISGIGQNLTAAGAQVFDATGLIVAPGFIDTCTCASRASSTPKLSRPVPAPLLPADSPPFAPCQTRPR